MDSEDEWGERGGSQEVGAKSPPFMGDFFWVWFDFRGGGGEEGT